MPERVSHLLLALCLPVFAAQSSPVRAETPFQVVGEGSTRIQISNALSGEVCSDDGEPLHVCKPGRTIDVRGREMCDWSEEVQYPCTRYGYELEFTGGDPKSVITCDVARSIRTIFGPGTEEVTGENTARYTEEVPGESGRIFHHGFQTYAPVERTVVVNEKHDCSYRGHVIYRVHFIHRFEPE